MKPSQRYVTWLATASVVLAAAAQAQSDRAPSGSMDARTGAIARISKDTVKDHFTAKDLLGAAVYDSTGEKIGDIADIDLQGAVPGQLAMAFNADKAGGDRSAASPTPATTPARSSASDTVSRASDTVSRAVAKVESAVGHATVLVSVGGLWGVGDDLVSVPVAQLSYNTAEDRFELPVRKADVVALAEGQNRPGYAADSPSRATSAGKQSFADEATRVQSALASDPQTSAFAYKVMVTGAGDSLEIRGTVDNKEQQKRIVEAARRATSLDIDDKTEIRK